LFTRFASEEGINAGRNRIHDSTFIRGSRPSDPHSFTSGLLLSWFSPLQGPYLAHLLSTNVAENITDLPSPNKSIRPAPPVGPPVSASASPSSLPATHLGRVVYHVTPPVRRARRARDGQRRHQRRKQQHCHGECLYLSVYDYISPMENKG
jgi:hypothetical protein